VKENYLSNASVVDTCFRDCINDFTSKVLSGKEEKCVHRCTEKFMKFTLRVDYAAAIYARSQEAAQAAASLGNLLVSLTTRPTSNPAADAAMRQKSTTSSSKPVAGKGGAGVQKESGRSRRAAPARRGGVSAAAGSGAGDEPLDLDANLTWAILGEDQIDELLEAQEVESVATKLAQFFGLPAWRDELQSNIAVSNLLTAFISARDYGMSPAQLSAYMSIIKTMLDRAVGLPQAKAVELFRRLLPSHASPPGGASSLDADGLGMFTPTEMAFVVDSVVTGLFQHYRLYQRVWASEQEQHDVEVAVELEEPAEVLPLAAAATLEEYEAEQERLRLVMEEEERRRAEAESERKRNPFEVLTEEELRRVAVETVAELVHAVRRDVDAMVDEQVTRHFDAVVRLAGAAGSGPAAV
ncbi:protein transporter tim9, partial [Cladochytrium tenue]